jgi:hypothetical protein
MVLEDSNVSQLYFLKMIRVKKSATKGAMIRRHFSITKK